MGSPVTRHDRSAPLTAAQLDQLRAMLEGLHSFRRDQIAQLRTEHPAPGPDAEIHESLLAGAQAALRDVLEALERMDEGSYGVCRECARPLPVERLAVLPQLSMCMACQRELEI